MPMPTTSPATPKNRAERAEIDEEAGEEWGGADRASSRRTLFCVGVVVT
jgi:hypothetical protein